MRLLPQVIIKMLLLLSLILLLLVTLVIEMVVLSLTLKRKLRREQGVGRQLKHVWNIPKGHRIVVNCNELDQPIGEEAGVHGKFLGTVARNGCLCSLSYEDWRLLIGKKERTTNQQKNKEDILKQVKNRFLYPARMKKWVLQTIEERWRQRKSNLKSIYFDAHKSKEANDSNIPEGVVPDQWIGLVNNWMIPKAQDISEANRINCAKRKAIHTAGTKSFSRNREELREKDPEKKNPHRQFCISIHTRLPAARTLMRMWAI